jgi:hypothetical protein
MRDRLNVEGPSNVVIIQGYIDSLAALAAQEAVPLCEEGCHVADQLGPHRRCVKCGHEWYFPAKPVAEASPQTDLAREWQPIETAPKMRKVIVHYVNALGKHRCVMACYYKAHSLEMSDDYSEVGEYNEATGESFAPEGWYEEHDQDHPLMPLSDEPDSWMPLPKPPDVAYLAACRQEQP